MEVIQSPFRICFKVLNLYGFYLPKDCKLRWKVYGIFMFLYIQIQYVVSSLVSLTLLQKSNKLLLLPILHIIFSVNLLFKIVSFKWHQSEILRILQDFNELESKMDKIVVKEKHSAINTLIILFYVFDITVGTVLGIGHLAVGHTKSFILPVLYGSNDDLIYYVLFFISYPQVYLMGTSLTSVESVFTVSLMMMEVQIEELKKVIRNVDGLDRESLKVIVEYQNKLQR